MDYKQIQELIKGFETSNITNLELEMDSLKIKLSKSVTTSPQVVVSHEVAPRQHQVEEKTSVGTEVKSPLVGTFYAAGSPTEEPYAKVGQHINKGDTVCIIEAMKIMNEITAPVSGVVEEILIKNGEVVSFDQVIMRIA